MDNKMLSEALISMLGAGNVRTGELMKTHTTFRIGGAADYYVTPQAEKQIADVIAFLKKSDIKYIVIGNGSNILVSDEGFRGVVVELGDGFSDYEFLQDSQDNSDEVLVKASAGMKLTRLGNQLAANGIAGFEFATGIPGCIGGAVRMNAGAYGGEFKDILVRRAKWRVQAFCRRGNSYFLPSREFVFSSVLWSTCVTLCMRPG